MMCKIKDTVRKTTDLLRDLISAYPSDMRFPPFLLVLSELENEISSQELDEIKIRKLSYAFGRIFSETLELELTKFGDQCSKLLLELSEFNKKNQKNNDYVDK